MVNIDHLLQYGMTSLLASKAAAVGLGVTKIRALSQADLVDRYGFEKREASEIKKCVKRQPIDADVAEALLSRSNHLCCVCKGDKGYSVILHHIVEYERSQDNSYNNLVVLCPNDHDRAHQSGLTLGLTPKMLQSAKAGWEYQVEVSNAQKAARAFRVNNQAVDYVNVARIEEICLQLFGLIPSTTISPNLQQAKILDKGLHFDERYVWKNLSNGSYLFDFPNAREPEHYRQLLTKISTHIEFEDLSEAARSGIRKLQTIEGRYAFFIGAVTSSRPDLPIEKSGPFEWRFKRSRVFITWHGDAKYLMSMSSISRQGQVNKYIIYCLVRTVWKPKAGPITVTCSPLLVAQPSVYVDRTPYIAFVRRRDGFFTQENDFDLEIDNTTSEESLPDCSTLCSKAVSRR